LFGRDLEQLTGCSREELGPALWYLREKQWARLGGFSEYTITAAGFDIVENEVMEPAAPVNLPEAASTPEPFAQSEPEVKVDAEAAAEADIEPPPPVINHRLL